MNNSNIQEDDDDKSQLLDGGIAKEVKPDYVKLSDLQMTWNDYCEDFDADQDCLVCY